MSPVTTTPLIPVNGVHAARLKGLSCFDIITGKSLHINPLALELGI